MVTPRHPVQHLAGRLAHPELRPRPGRHRPRRHDRCLRNTHGLNANDPADHGLIAANGYTNLENYLNGLAIPLGTSAAQTVVARLEAFPNPATDQLTLNYPVAGPAAHLQVLDALGRTVLTAPVAAGSTTSTLSLLALPAGLYEVVYRNASQRLTATVSRQ